MVNICGAQDGVLDYMQYQGDFQIDILVRRRGIRHSRQGRGRGMGLVVRRQRIADNQLIEFISSGEITVNAQYCPVGVEVSVSFGVASPRSSLIVHLQGV